MFRRPTDWIGVAALLLGCCWAQTGHQDHRQFEIVTVKGINTSKRTFHQNSTSFIFTAFRKTFVLQLEPCAQFLSSSFHIITYTNYNMNCSSLKVKRGQHLKDCIFRGHVKNDVASIVSLNICKGLNGFIRTCDGDYEIQPYTKTSSSKLHIVYKQKDHGNNSCNLIGNGGPYHLKFQNRLKRSVSNEWNLETMVVADSKMKSYHGENLEMYILTLMSSVALIYKDPSIGNNINIIIVKLVIMNEDEDKGIIYPSASKTLRNFCRWQKEQHGVQGHDTAILLTREDLCRYSKTCDTLGLAQSGMVCDPGSSCAVIEDNGLSAAFTVAHEIGHILGVPHDDDKKCSRFHVQGQRLHVMARMLDYNSYPHSWSECSKHHITTFLDAGYGHCLSTKSSQDLLRHFEHANTLPGELYDMDYQCELVFGKGSRICPYMPVCKRLWCTMEDITLGGCRTMHMPWADGTRCGPYKSCFHGECISDPVSFPPGDGEWGEWQKYGSCSRSCGGGVARSVRYCDNPKPTHGGQYCVGDRVRYKSCQTQECPPDAKDFREEQCAAFNAKTFGFSGITDNVRWVPHFSESEVKERCKLYCRAAGSAAYFLLKEKVIDGTTCGPETFDICINGKCMAAGCDHVLNSVKVLDSCGECGGNGSSCKVMRGNYLPKTIKYGYNSVIKIPTGASNIDIVQYGLDNSADDNYLALKGIDGKFILNGNFMISMFPKSVEYGGCLFDYSGSSIAIERINASKRLQKDVHVQVLAVGTLHPPDISYEYTASVFTQDKYHWHLEDAWSPCNSICQGEQYRKAICVDGSDGHTVSDDLCRKQRPAHEARTCNPTCFLRWRAKAITPCSSHCGLGVVRNTVECSQVLETDEILIVPSNNCAHIEPKPLETEECVGPCRTREWKYGEWSQCSVTCGTGEQQRTAKCVGDEIVHLHDPACNTTNKIIMKLCAMEECPRWETGDWSECSASCSNGWKKRQISCVFENQTVSYKKCAIAERPPDQMPCEKEKCKTEIENESLAQFPSRQMNAVWVIGNWSTCSTSCGSGLQRRRVDCITVNNRSRDDACNPHLRPRSVKICRREKCLHTILNTSDAHSAGYWRTGLWGKCSKSCGSGVRRRQVACYDDEGHMSTKCNLLRKPLNTSVCNEERCPSWKIGPWSECSVSCGKGIQIRSVQCFNLKEIQLSVDRCQLPPPIDKKRCKRTSCLQWSWSQWSPCSSSCSGGTQTRISQCRQGSRIVNDELCKDIPKPNPEVKYCNRQNCKIHWKKESWSKCSATCGKGYKHRHVSCANGKNEEIDERRCNYLRKPKTKRKCHRFKCTMTWIADKWSECSRTCGRGVEVRSVTCHRVNAYHWIDPKPVAANEQMTCKPSEKPPLTRACNLGQCSGNIWKVGPWLPCSVTCGSGKQRRRIRCYSLDGNRLPNTECEKIAKPQRRRQCYPRPCPAISCLDFKKRGNITEDGEEEIFMRGRYVKIFCARMNTSQPQEYITLPRGEQDNYSEVYSKRLKNASVCPYKGARFDACDCVSDENIDAGLTSFQKIAINASSLSVFTHDMAFAQTHKGEPVPFAESGDCYSKVSCPQGRFSLSLLGTGFIVSPLTKWITVGNYSSSRIRWLEGGQVIQGKCGGYCARCSTTGHSGLLLDVAPP